MINSTIFFLNLYWGISTSPIYTIHKSSKMIQLSFSNTHISRSFQNIIFSSSKYHSTIVSNCQFINILNSSINLNSEDGLNNCFLYNDPSYQPNSIINDKVIVNGQSHFTLDCGNITIANCIFVNCSSLNSFGGAVNIQQDCFVLIHSTIFDRCSTQTSYGGACFIAKKYKH